MIVNALKIALEELKSAQTVKEQVTQEFRGRHFSDADINNMHVEMETSYNHLQELLDKHHEDPRALNEALRYFLRIRWGLIRRSSLAYCECPSTMNQICELLAIAIAQPGESIAKILMPTLTVEHYGFDGETLISLTERDDGLGLDFNKFIISHDGKAVIPIKDWFDNQNVHANEPNLDHLYLINPQGSHQFLSEDDYMAQKRAEDPDYATYTRSFKPVPLSAGDLQSLKYAAMPASEAYIKAIEERKKAFGNGMFKALKKLCQDCFDNGVSSHKKDENGEATESHPHPDVYPLIREFLSNAWNPLSAEEKKTMASMRSGRNTYTLGDYLLVLRAGAQDYLTPQEEYRRRDNNLHTCVEVNAHAITRILNAYAPPINRHINAVNRILQTISESPKHISNASRYAGGEKKLSLKLAAYKDCLNKQPINQDMARLIIYYAADCRETLIQNPDKNFILQWAVRNADLNCAQALLQTGIDIATVLYTNGSTILHFAGQHGWNEVIDFCLEKGVDVNSGNTDGWAALHFAARDGKENTVRHLLAKGANLNAVTGDTKKTVFELALLSGHFDIVKLLIEKGAKIELKHCMELINNHRPNQVKELLEELIKTGIDLSQRLNNDGDTLLHYACKNGFGSMVTLLMEKGMKIDAVNASGLTPLSLAVSFHHPEVLKLILSRGTPDVYAAWRKELCMAGSRENVDVATYLINEGKAAIGSFNVYAQDNIPVLVYVSAQTKRLAPLMTEHPMDINAKDSAGWTALHYAAAYSEIRLGESVKTLLDKGASINAQNSEGNTPLHLAAANRHAWSDLEQLLYKKYKANFNLINHAGQTALDIAVNAKNPHNVRLLVKAGGPESKIYENGKTLLEIAAINGWVEVIDAMLYWHRNVTNINAKNTNGQTALHLAAANNHPRVMRLLLKNGANMDEKDNNGLTALHLAASEGHKLAAGFLLREGKVKIDAQDNNGWTPLQLAVSKNDLEMTEFLISMSVKISKKSMINLQDNQGKSALHLAAEHGYEDIVNCLIEINADLNLINKAGRSALNVAAQNGRTNVVEILIKAGAALRESSNANDKLLLPLLHTAINYGWNTVLAALLQRDDLNINAVCQGGWTALHRAVRLGQHDTVKSLIELGADFDLPKEDGWTALHLAIANGRVTIVELLLNNGANFNPKTSAGETALSMAVQAGHQNIIVKLIKAGVDTTIETYGPNNLYLINYANTQNWHDVVSALSTQKQDYTYKRGFWYLEDGDDDEWHFGQEETQKRKLSFD